MIHLQLFGAFFKIGLFTIGGGLAALPLFQRELLALGWITPTEFIDMVAISQATPGPIGVNMATFAGFRVASYSGAVAATAGLAAPSLIIIVIIARFMKDYAHRPAVLIGNGNLGLAVRPQPGQRSILAHPAQAAAEAVGQGNGQGHELRCLIAGKAEHHALISGTGVGIAIHFTLLGFEGFVNTHCDVGALLID